MVKKTSKNHEKEFLESFFVHNKEKLETLGYCGYSFEHRLDCNGVPDGSYVENNRTIWIEHSEANPNYGEKGKRLVGKEGFCLDVGESLFNEVKGCICCDISSQIADRYLNDNKFKMFFLEKIRSVITSNQEYIDDALNIRIKYCSPERCLFDLSSYNGLRVRVQGFRNFEFNSILSIDVLNKIIKNKERKYKDNLFIRDENWLIVEIPFGYSFRDDELPYLTDYFDRVMLVGNFDYEIIHTIYKK